MFKSFHGYAIEDTVSSWFDQYTAASKDPNLARRVRFVTRRLRNAKPSLLNTEGRNGLVNSTRDTGLTFAHIQVIATAILDILLEDSDTMSYTTPRKVTSKLEVEGGSLMNAAANYDHNLHAHTRPIFYKGPEGMDSNTLNVAGIFATQSHDTANQIVQNQKQILVGGSYILANNPCRRFVFGLTTEHHCMRFWYLSRSHIAVSEAVDSHEHPEYLVQFLVFLVSASPQQLGFDPSARRLDDAGAREQLVHEYHCGGGWYQRTNVISENCALDTGARGLRIWKVRKLVQHDDDTPTGKSGDETYVLKDAWLYKGVQCEHIIRQTMCDRLIAPDAQDSEPRKSDAPQDFMTIMHDVPVMVDANDVASPKATTARERFFVRAERGEGGLNLKYRGRTLWRIPYKEVCQDLYTVTSSRLYFKALSTAVKGLKSLRLAEMVHGDLSPANVLLFGSDGAAKIADLESCREHIITGTFRDPKYGTPGFMAIEICAGRHLFVKYPVKFFRHNFLHDLESCIWMALYFLFHRIPECLVSAKRMPLLHALWHESKLLNSGLKRDITARTFLFSWPHPIVFVGHLIKAYDEVPAMQGFLDAVFELREKSTKEYAVLEASDPVVAHNVEQWDVDFFRLPFYDEFAAYFLHCSELALDVGPFSSLREILEKAAAGSLEDKEGKSDQDVLRERITSEDNTAMGQSVGQGKPLEAATSCVQATSSNGSPVMSKRKSAGGLETSRSVKKPRVKKSDATPIRRLTRLQEEG